jgi:hypothetical protein
MILPIALLLAEIATPSEQKCGACHAKEAAALRTSPMTRALQKPTDSDLLQQNPDLNFRVGKYSYAIRRQGDSFLYSVSDGKDTLSAPIQWAFGKGIIGQTYLLERGGTWYEGAVSLYSGTQALDLTPGHEPLPRRTLDEAFGRKIDAPEMRRCVGCHSTDAVWGRGTPPESVLPGVQCWQCHKNGQQHAAAVIKGDVRNAKIVKLNTLSTEDLGVVCSQCHPSWAEVSAKGPRGPLNVRMQLYRLTNSRCYNSADRRISCTACHDPHGSLETRPSVYDSKCLQCHGPGSAKTCAVAKQDCTSCHMPKVELPGMHYQFTDHQIRIVRPGEGYPN